jgi:hypothetical protein
LYAFAGSYYLIVVNSENTPAQGVGFSLQGGKKAVVQPARVEVVFENRSAAVQDGGWNDDFEPYAVHIYAIKKSKPRATIDLAGL